MTWIWRACAIGGILMTVADLWQEPGQAPVFRATTQVVTVQASVLEGKTPVEGLSAEDFVLLDNGVRQRVEVTAVEATPLDVTLVFDENYFSLAVIGRRFDSNLSKIAKLLRPTDRLNDPDQRGWSLFDALVLALDPPAVLERQTWWSRSPWAWIVGARCWTAANWSPLPSGPTPCCTWRSGTSAAGR